MRWLQLIIALSFLVVIHELGHFTFARIFKVRVEKFYMFFNPRFSLLRAKKLGGRWRVKFFAKNEEPAVVELEDPITHEQKVDKKGQPLYRPMTDEERAALPEDDWRREPDNTEWGIGWLPFGGYCSIAGMVDETKSLKDLGLDSLDVVEMCLALEDRYGIQFETSELSSIKTVSDLYGSIEAKLDAKK